MNRGYPLPSDLLCDGGKCKQRPGAVTPSVADTLHGGQFTRGCGWNKAVSEHMWREHTIFVPMPQVLQKWFREEGFILAMLAPLWGGVHSEHHRGEGMMGRAIGVVAVGNQEGAGDEAREGSGTGKITLLSQARLRLRIFPYLPRQLPSVTSYRVAHHSS